jgi:hypothetical protein
MYMYASCNSCPPRIMGRTFSTSNLTATARLETDYGPHTFDILVWFSVSDSGKL